MKVAKIIAVLLLFAAVPWALYYNANYDRYGAAFRQQPPVFIQIATVDAGSFNNTLKSKAAEYAAANSGVRIFVLPLNTDQIGTQEFDIRIIRDAGTLHAFISHTQTGEAVSHCEKFLSKIQQELEGIKISIK